MKIIFIFQIMSNIQNLNESAQPSEPQPQTAKTEEQQPQSDEQQKSTNNGGHNASQNTRRSPTAPRKDSDDSSFKNDVPKRYNEKSSQFKVHFFVKKVPTVGMNDDEFLHFIKRKVSLAGQCEVLQILPTGSNHHVDIAIGMRNDDDAKLVYLGKKHFNFGRPGKQREAVELSTAFENYLSYNGIKDKDHLDREMRKNLGRTRSRSHSSKHRSRSRSHPRQKKYKNEGERQGTQSKVNRRKTRSTSSKSDSKPKKNKRKYSDSSSGSSRSESHSRPHKPQPYGYTTQPALLNPGPYLQPYPQYPPQPQILGDNHSLLIFAVPKEHNEHDVISQISSHGLPLPINTQWKIDQQEKVHYLELQFSDEKTVQIIQQMKPCFTVQTIPLLVIPKKNRPVIELLRNYEINVELSAEVSAYFMYEEFKKYGEVIGIYVFNSATNYLLLYASNTNLQDSLKPPTQKTIIFKNNQQVTANIRIADKPVGIQRPNLQETLVYQLKNYHSYPPQQQQEPPQKKNREQKSKKQYK